MTRQVPRGIKNNNPGNIWRTDIDWLGELEGGDPNFETFDTPEHGIRALGKVLQSYQRKYRIRTVRACINRYAPSATNDTVAYIEDVCQRTGFTPGQRINFQDSTTLQAMVKAIIWHENGQQPYADAVITHALGER